MAKIKKNDFVEVDFTGKIKETKEVFDTTSKKVALENNLSDKADYKPVIICVGQGHIFRNIENILIGKEAGRKYKVELKPEEAFGKKDAKMITLVPTSVFRKQNINPVPGLGVNINNQFGVIRTVTGGRCMVDFNHPLSGKELSYDIKARKIVKDSVEKVKALIEMDLRINEVKVEKKDKEIKVIFDDKVKKHLTDEMKKRIMKRVNKLTGEKIAIA